MRKVILSIFALFVLSLVAAACGEEAAAPQIITKEVVVEKEVLVEVPVEVVVTKEVVRTVQVPGETIIVEKEVVRTVEVPGETIVVTKEVVKEVPVEVPGETIIVEKEVVKVVEVERVVEVMVDRIIEIPTVIEVDRVFSRFGEAPELTQLVQAGGIDPVIDRLPSQPMVIPVFGEIGKYGGTLRRFYIGPADGCNFFRLSKVSLVRFSKDGFSLIPSVARGWEVTPDGKTWTFHLREGHRWSDGAPFTADDIMYQYNDVILNDELSSGATPTFLRSLNESATITKVDDTTIQIAFPNPNFIFLEIAAQADEACYGSTRNIPWAPAHYMQQFHTEFNTGAVQMAKDAGFGDWTELYDEKTSYNLNPDKPALTPWHFTTQLGGQLVKAERNAYFMGVDPEGNQLPYLNGIQMVLVDNPEVGTLKAVQGLLDLQGRHIQLPDFPVLKDGEEKGKYHILTWPTFGGTDVTMYPNQDYPGVTGEAISNRTFRQALSIAIDRDSVNEISFLGLGTPRMNVPKPGHPHYPGAEYEFKFTEFDRALAIEMMDSIYPEKDSEGFRTINGERIVMTIGATPAFGPWPDVAEQVGRAWEAIGVKSDVQIMTRTLLGTRAENNELAVHVWNHDDAGFTFSSTGKNTFPAFRLSNSWFVSQGSEGQPPPQWFQDFFSDIMKGPTLPDAERNELGKKVWRTVVDEMVNIGIVGLSPMVQGVLVVKNDLKNVPDKAGNDWPLRTPNTGFPEQWFFDR